MTTTEAIKFNFSGETYDAIKGNLSRPELLKTACIVAFKRNWDAWPKTSLHWQVAFQLRKALTTLEETGMFVE